MVSFLLLAVLPLPAWAAFSRVFQAWFDIFNFRVVIDQAVYAPTVSAPRPYLFIVVPHGVVPLGSFLGLSYVRNYLPSKGAWSICPPIYLFVYCDRRVIHCVMETWC